MANRRSTRRKAPPKQDTRPLHDLAGRLRARFPTLEASIDEALHSDRGTSVLDLLLGDQALVVEWSPDRGFGVSSRPDDSYGEGPDEAFASLEDTAERIERLLLSRTHTSPPAPADLAELRRRLGFSQVALAKRMRVQQASISKLERRKDARISTLTTYVKAMGATVQIVAHTPLGTFRLRTLGRGTRAKSKGKK